MGGADVGPTVGVVGSSGPGCGSFTEESNQFCYSNETCDGVVLEVECEVNGPGPFNCWCFQAGAFVGTCTEGDRPSCSPDGCCEFLFTSPG